MPKACEATDMLVESAAAAPLRLPSRLIYLEPILHVPLATAGTKFGSMNNNDVPFVICVSKPLRGELL